MIRKAYLAAPNVLAFRCGWGMQPSNPAFDTSAQGVFPTTDKLMHRGSVHTVMESVIALNLRGFAEFGAYSPLPNLPIRQLL